MSHSSNMTSDNQPASTNRLLLRPPHLDLLLTLEGLPGQSVDSKKAWARLTCENRRQYTQEKYLRAIASLPASLIVSRRVGAAWAISLAAEGRQVLSGEQACRVFGVGPLVAKMLRGAP
jgi:hypothetical protein